MSTTAPLQTTGKYSAKWQKRFDFFSAHGAPNDPSFAAALKALPSLGSKLLIQMNWIAFFFGPIYLFVLGLWKKNLAMLGVFLAINLVLSVIFAVLGMEIPRALGSGLNIAGSMMYSLTTNYSYYLKEIKGEQTWNPFKGFRFI